MDQRDRIQQGNTTEGDVFDGADLESLYVGDRTFRRLSFRGALMAHFNGFNVIFEDCDFTGADLFKAELLDSVMRRCRFDEADLRGVFAADTSFEGCTFEGSKIDGLLQYTSPELA